MCCALRGFFACLSCVLLTLLAAPPTARASGAVHIKVATLAPKGSVYHRVLQDIGAAIRSSEGPESSFTVYTDGSQGGEADVVRRMRIGQLNGALMTAVGLSEIDQSVTALQMMPLLFRTPEEIEFVGSALRPQIERNFLARGFVAVMWSEAGWVRFFSRESIAVPADLKARKIFAWAGQPDQVELMKQLGYKPIVLETADIIPGLQTGLIDCVALTPMFALATQADVLAPHMVDVKWAPIAGALVFTQQAWEQMKPATRAAIHAAVLHAADAMRVYQQRADAEAIAAMQARGLKVQHLDAAQLRHWDDFAAEIYPLIRGHMIPAATFDETMRLVAEYRARPPTP